MPVGAAIDPDVSFSPDTAASTAAPVYDRRSAFKLETAAARKAKIAWLRAACVSTATSYIVVEQLGLSVYPPASALLKALPILLLVWLTLLMGDASSYATRVAAGLAFSAVGDACLALEGSGGAHLFLCGLFAFLLGHLCYGAAFLTNPVKPGALTLGLPVVYAASVFAHLWPSLPASMAPPVALYCAVLGGVLVLALARTPQGHAPGWSARCAAAGGVLFAASDTALASDRFVAALPHAKLLVLTGYYAAQLLLALSSRGAQPRPLTSALGSVENLTAKRHKEG